MSPVLQLPVEHAAGWLRSAAPLARPAVAAHLADWLRLALPIAQPAVATICMSAILYYLYAIYSARKFFGERPRWTSRARPPISILKPIRGLDVGAYENFASFCPSGLSPVRADLRGRSGGRARARGGARRSRGISRRLTSRSSSTTARSEPTGRSRISRTWRPRPSTPTCSSPTATSGSILRT